MRDKRARSDEWFDATGIGFGPSNGAPARCAQEHGVHGAWQLFEHGTLAGDDDLDDPDDPDDDDLDDDDPDDLDPDDPDDDLDDDDDFDDDDPTIPIQRPPLPPASTSSPPRRWRGPANHASVRRKNASTRAAT
jgi:hypothetical protein